GQWRAFEATMIALMRRGIRGRIFWLAFVLPLGATASVVGLSCRLLAVRAAYWITGGVAAVVAYLCWHYRAAHLLRRIYDRELFRGTLVRDLASGNSPHPD